MPESATYVIGECDCLRWRGTWDSGTTYSAKNMVHYSGSAYIALRVNTNAQPDTSSSDWELIA